MKAKKTIILAFPMKPMRPDDYARMSVKDFDRQFVARKEPEELGPIPVIKNGVYKRVYRGLEIDVWNGLYVRDIPANGSVIDSAIYEFRNGTPLGETLFVQDYSGRNIIKHDLKKFYEKHGWGTKYDLKKNFSKYRKDVIFNLEPEEEDEILEKEVEDISSLMDELGLEPPDSFYA